MYFHPTSAYNAAQTSAVIRYQDGFWDCDLCNECVDGQRYKVSGFDVCKDCCHCCHVCGEFITDESVQDCGPQVQTGRFEWAHEKCLEGE